MLRCWPIGVVALALATGLAWPVWGQTASVSDAGAVATTGEASLAHAPAGPAANWGVSPPPGYLEIANQRLARMTLEQRVNQTLIVGFSGTQMNNELEDLVRAQVGGIALFSRNIETPDQTAKLTEDIRRKADLPPFIAIDQEGGQVVRLKKGAIILPSHMALGATRSRTLAYLAGRALGADLYSLGINMNLAPVLDVNSNAANPVIGTRSFGERPELVGELGSWFVRGQQETGIVAVAKHFPGHGDTTTDSHYDMPVLAHGMSRLQKIELVPFKMAAKAGLDAMMTAHIALPNVAESPSLPATLSRRLLHDVLRKEVGFEGLVITDGLEMRGIVEGEGIGEAAVRAFLAGADMLMVLWSRADRDTVRTAMMEAVRSGRVSQQRLEQSVRRILIKKAERQIDRKQTPPRANELQRLLHDQLAEEIAERAVTLVRDRKELVPLRDKRVLLLAPEGSSDLQLSQSASVWMPQVPTRERRQRDVVSAISKSENVDVIVGLASNRYHVEVIRAVKEAVPNIPMVFVSLASPYYLLLLPSADTYLCTYSSASTAQRALSRVLTGKRGTVGRLPVTIPQLYPYGTGVVEDVEGAASGGTGSAAGAAAAGTTSVAVAGVTDGSESGLDGSGGAPKSATRTPK